MRPSRRSLLALAAACVMMAAFAPTSAQTASALLREGDALPGAPGETVSSLNNPVVNHAGGYAVTLNTTGSGTTLSHVWGNAGGGPGTVIITEGTIGNLQQTSFESFHGLSNAGVPSYSALSTDLITGTTGLDGVWLGTLKVLQEEDPVPTIADNFSSFNSRPGVTADGIPYWVGGITKIQGSSTQNRVLFYGTSLTPVLVGGDSIGNVAEPIKTTSSNIDFDYRFSELGTHYILPVLVDSGIASDGVVVIDGDGLMLGGGIVREGSPVPASVGGLSGEVWDNFDFMGITETGSFFFTGDTNASTSLDEFVLVDGQIVLREGDTLGTLGGPVTLSGSIEGGYLNKDGDWAVTWDVDTPGGNVEALIVNGEVLLMEGDPVDLDGDGIVEPGSILANFTGLTALVIGDRDGVGVAPVYFTADIDTAGTPSSGDDTEGLFRLNVQVGTGGIELPLDIKPGSCPNSFNADSQGVLPVAVLGTMDVDAISIDLASVRISRMGGGVAPNEGPPGPHSMFQDVATPLEGDACDCHGLGADGMIDLSLFFQSEIVGPALGLTGAEPGSVVELVVSGNLLDGTPFFATDCVRIVPPNNGPGDGEDDSSDAGAIDPWGSFGDALP